MTVPVRDPRWKVGGVADVDKLAEDVTECAANLKALLQQSTKIRAGIEKQMGGSYSGMMMLTRPMRTLEEASSKVDQASWALQDFAEKFRKVSL